MSEANTTDDAVRRLLQDAGPRPSIPEEDLAAITAAARAAWRERYGGRKAPGKPPGRWWMGLAAAAALALAAGLAGWMRTAEPPPAAAPALASIEVLTGTVRMWPADGEAPVLLGAGAPGTPLPAGAELETGDGDARLALRWAGGASVRLDAGTRVRLAVANQIELARGAVYVDSEAGPGHRGLAVRTAAGLFQEIGTQFEVRIEPAGTRLRVREGRVALDRGREPVLAGAGEELIVQRNGSLDRRSAAVYGPDWDWVLETAPRLDIEGLKVRDFLDWIAREEGWRLEFAGPEAATLATTTTLHGSIEHLTLAEAPYTVLASCGLGHEVTGGTMSVFVAEGDAR